MKGQIMSMDDMRLEETTSPFGVQELRFVGVDEDTLMNLLPDYALEYYPYEKAIRLLDGIYLMRTSSRDHAWGAVKDRKGRMWRICTKNDDIRKEWKPERKLDGTRAKTGAMYRDPAVFVANMMLGSTAIYRDSSLVKKLASNKSREVMDCIYRVHSNTDGRFHAEISMDNKQMATDEVQVLLMLMSHFQGIKTIRDVFSINGESYVQEHGVIKHVRLGEDEVPLREITVPRSGLAVKELRPVLGAQGFDGLCMALAFTVIAKPQGYFVISDDGGSGKSTILTAFCSLFADICTDTFDPTNLPRKGYDAANEWLELVGKSIAVIDEDDGSLTAPMMKYLNAVSSGKGAKVRWNGGGSHAYCHAWSIIATNTPDKLPELTAVIRRRITIMLNGADEDAWKTIIDDGNGERMPLYDYAGTEECIAEMVEYGMTLILERQEQFLKANPGRTPSLQDMFEKVSVADKNNAANAVYRFDDEVVSLARKLFSDPGAREFVKNGKPGSYKTRLRAGSFVKNNLPNLMNAETFLNEHGIDYRQRSIKDYSRNITDCEDNSDNRLAVVVLRDSGALKDLYDLIADAETDNVDEPKWSLVPKDYSDNGNATIQDCVNTLAAGVNDYLGDGYDMHYEEEDEVGEPHAIITHEDGSGTTEVSRLAVTIGTGDETNETNDSLILTRDTATIRLADTGKIYTLKKYAHLVKQHHGQPIGQAANHEPDASTTAGKTPLTARTTTRSTTDEDATEEA